MPRPLRFCPPGYTVHVVQRGNNRAACFTSDADLAAYAHWLAEGTQKYELKLHAWVFMTNHVHLLLTPSSQQGVSRLVQLLGRKYVQRFNYRYDRSGTLFGRFKSSIVQNETHLINCLRYIELNPVRAGLARDAGDYRWSSYRTHAFGQAVDMWTPHPEYLALREADEDRQAAYRHQVSQALSVEAIDKIRHCVNTGLVLGNKAFREQVESLHA